MWRSLLHYRMKMGNGKIDCYKREVFEIAGLLMGTGKGKGWSRKKNLCARSKEVTENLRVAKD